VFEVTHARKNPPKDEAGVAQSPESILSCQVPARTEERAIEKAAQYWRELGEPVGEFTVKSVIDLDD
jgi:hypothetical protein